MIFSPINPNLLLIAPTTRFMMNYVNGTALRAPRFGSTELSAQGELQLLPCSQSLPLPPTNGDEA